jgi:Uncharacterized enzyme of heme biosynthesis
VTVSRAAIAAILLVSGFGAGCSGRGQPEVSAASSPATESSAGGITAGERQDYRDALEKRLEAIDRRLEALDKQVKARGGQVSRETQKAMDDLRARRRDISRQIERIDEVSASGWHSFRRGLDKAVDDLEGAYNRTLETMKTNQ